MNSSTIASRGAAGRCSGHPGAMATRSGSVGHRPAHFNQQLPYPADIFRARQLVGDSGDAYADVDAASGERVTGGEFLDNRPNLVVAESAAQDGEQRDVVLFRHPRGIARPQPVHDGTETRW